METINLDRQAVSIVADAYGVADPDVTAVLTHLLDELNFTADDVLSLIVDGIRIGAALQRQTSNII